MFDFVSISQKLSSKSPHTLVLLNWVKRLCTCHSKLSKTSGWNVLWFVRISAVAERKFQEIQEELSKKFLPGNEENLVFGLKNWGSTYTQDGLLHGINYYTSKHSTNMCALPQGCTSIRAKKETIGKSSGQGKKKPHHLHQLHSTRSSGNPCQEWNLTVNREKI